MNLLVVDDESRIRQFLERYFSKRYRVFTAEDGESGLKVLNDYAIDMVITDFQMPNMDGLTFIKEGKKASPSTQFLMMTAHGSIDNAVEALKIGAQDYITKPFDIVDIDHRIRRMTDLISWNNEKKLRSDSPLGTDRMVGTSKNIRDAKKFVAQASDATSPVMLLGPSGSGKEVLARAIHESGPRANRAFVAINCASLNENLLESDLFGHEKGSFTGATAAKVGKFELANGGTIFLDEVGELNESAQAKLLRVIQEKEFFRVGGVKTISTDARIITATHRPLKDMVAEKSFREDLFFRLNVLQFRLMPLAKRQDDILPLTDFLWAKLLRETGKQVSLTEEVKKKLLNYSFPGNVRELQNLLERLLVWSSNGKVANLDGLSFEVFPESRGSSSSATFPFGKGAKLAEFIEGIESDIIRQAMEKSDYNGRKASEILGMTHSTLKYKLQKYQIRRPSSDSEEDAA